MFCRQAFNKTGVLRMVVRFKGNKARVKHKAPPPAKEKAKFVPKAFVEKQMAAAAAAEKLIATERPGAAMDGDDLEEWLKRKPVDNVWIREHYPPQPISVADAVIRHRELAQPAMLNNPNGLLYLNLRLDMTTAKKTKFVGQFSNTVRLPHEFDDGRVRRILAFCKTTADQDTAQAMGAIRVGLDELVKAIQEDELTRSDYDFAVATVDVVAEILPARSKMKDRFPAKIKGTLGASMAELMEFCLKGKTYESERLTDAVAALKTPFGRLKMEPQQLEENVKILMASIAQQKQSGGQFIARATITCPPSTEEFFIDHLTYIPKQTKQSEGNRKGKKQVASSASQVAQESSSDIDEDQEESGNTEKVAAKAKHSK